MFYLLFGWSSYYKPLHVHFSTSEYIALHHHLVTVTDCTKKVTSMCISPRPQLSSASPSSYCQGLLTDRGGKLPAFCEVAFRALTFWVQGLRRKTLCSKLEGCHIQGAEGRDYGAYHRTVKTLETSCTCQEDKIMPSIQITVLSKFF